MSILQWSFCILQLVLAGFAMMAIARADEQRKGWGMFVGLIHFLMCGVFVGLTITYLVTVGRIKNKYDQIEERYEKIKEQLYRKVNIKYTYDLRIQGDYPQNRESQ